MTNSVLTVLDSGRSRPMNYTDSVSIDGGSSTIDSIFIAVISDLTTTTNAMTTFAASSCSVGHFIVTGTAQLGSGTYNLINKDLYIWGSQNGSTGPTFQVNNGSSINLSNSSIYHYNLTWINNANQPPYNVSAAKWGYLYFYGCSMTITYGNGNPIQVVYRNILTVVLDNCSFLSTGSALCFVGGNTSVTEYNFFKLIVKNSVTRGALINQNGGRIQSISCTISNSKILDEFGGVWYITPGLPGTQLSVSYSSDSKVSQALISGSASVTFVNTGTYPLSSIIDSYVNSVPTPTTIAYKGQKYWDGATYIYKCVSGDGSTTGTWVRKACETTWS